MCLNLSESFKIHEVRDLWTKKTYKVAVLCDVLAKVAFSNNDSQTFSLEHFDQEQQR